jgi:perosamine synthetase
MIDLFKPYIPQGVINEVSNVLHTRWIGQGPKVNLFERRFEEKFGIKNAVSVNSGTAALETAYDLIGLKPGDEVISTPLTCTATNLPLVRLGIKIVWADIRRETLCIDPVDVRAKITEKTKAIIQVHLGGIRADVGCNHIPVVSDAAQALGIFTGDYTCCSFQAIKHITTGDGGMLVCPGERKRNEAKMYRWFGIDREKKIANNWQAYKDRKMTFDIKFPGAKRHMNDIAAAMGLVGLEAYDDVMRHRSRLFDLYRRQLAGIPGITLIDGPENKYWLTTILVERRDDFARKMFEEGIDTNLVQIRNDVYKIFGGERADLPVLNSIEDKYCSIPIGMHVSEDDVNYICDVIKGGW